MNVNYYNEFDKGAAAWLRELINAKLIPFGYVDERSITEVTASDVQGFTQCHFFAGIGGWPLALQLAGVPTSTRLWTGSPPCQPFSTAGKQLGQFDERHLAPVFLNLVSKCKPPVLFGEQVAAAIGKSWMCDLQTHLEGEDYAVGFTVLPACSVGAPHKRERLFFGAYQLAYTDSERLQRERRDCYPQGREGQNIRQAGLLNGTGAESGMGDTDGSEFASRQLQRGGNKKRPEQSSQSMLPRGANTHNGFWSDVDWLGCRDGKFRPVEAWTQQMVDGVPSGMGCSSDPSLRKAIEEIGFPLGTNIPARVARLRGYGNAIVPQVAAEFVKAFMSCKAP